MGTAISTVSEESTIPGEFDRAAALYADRTAIGAGTWQPTYSQLKARAGALAVLVQSRCIAQSRIAILQQPDGPLIASLLGTLKAGCIAAVLNPSDPKQRLHTTLQTLEPALLLTDQRNFPLATEVGVRSVDVVRIEDIADAGDHRIESTPDPGDLAVLIQTSGSMGQAKWVMQTHRNLVHLAERHNSVMRLTHADRVLLLASPSGSQALATIWTSLFHGAAVCPFPAMERGILGLETWLREQRISVYISAASIFRRFAQCLRTDDRFPDVRLVKLGAEEIRARDIAAVRQHFPDCETIYCSYSSAEAGNMAQLCLGANQDLPAGGVPLGTAANDIEIQLLDEAGDPVPDGEKGEIVVRSQFLSPGYWRDPKRTQARFSEGPAEGARSYRTGDLAWRDEHGSLWFAGRRDRAVKIRGTKVSLDRLENELRAIEGVRDAVVCERMGADGSLGLCAFVCAGSTAEQIRTELAKTLPDVVIPAQFVLLDELPLNAHGKVDRAALEQLAEPAAFAPSANFETAVEDRLADIWAQTFGQRPPNRDARIFDSGVDSLTLAVLAAKIEERFGAALDMQDFVDHPALSALALKIEQVASHGSALPAVEVAPEGTPVPLSFAQQVVWDECQKSAAARAGYVMARYLKLSGELDVEALRVAVNDVFARHDILRTVYPVIDGKAHVVVRPAAPVEVPLFDLSSEPDAQTKALHLFDAETRRPMDLGEGPLVRYVLIRLAQDEHWFVRISHHIVADGWSWVQLFRELDSAYAQHAVSKQSAMNTPVRPNGPQYGDYAVWERRVFAPGTKARANVVRWWRDTLASQTSPMELPFRRRISPLREPKPEDGVLRKELDESLKRHFLEFARRENVTHSAIGLSPFAALLAASAHRTSVVLGVHMTNRRSAVLHNVLGDFAILAPLCLNVDLSVPFKRWVSMVQQRLGETQAHAQLPQEEIAAELRTAGIAAAPIQAIFIGSNPKFPAQLGDVRVVRPAYPHKTMPWGFTLNLDVHDAMRGCEITFNARLYDPGKVKRFMSKYLRLLEAGLRQPEIAVRELVD